MSVKVDFSLVSIVIPAFNGARYLRESVDSVLAQDYKNIELIVLNDGSTDETEAILQSYGNRFFWASHANIGQAETLNKGWQLSRGDYLSYLSVDDVLEPSAVRIAIDMLENQPDTVMVYGDYRLINDEGDLLQTVRVPEYSYKDLVARLICQPGPGVFMRRSAFQSTGGWNGKYQQVPDLEYWFRLSLQGKFSRVPEVIAKFRVHDLSQTYAPPPIEKADECIRVVDEFYNREYLPSDVRKWESLSRANSLLVSARFHLRAGRFSIAFNRIASALRLFPLSPFLPRGARLLASGVVFSLRNSLGQHKNTRKQEAKAQ